MPRHDVVVDCPVHDSFRVRQVAGLFDLPPSERSQQTFSVELPGLEEEWQIGAIVGPSGSGKTSIARSVFGSALQQAKPWSAQHAVIDGFGEHSIRTLTQLLGAVGFNSPPAWLRPYSVLSRGEQFRCDLARSLLAATPLVVLDEFTSLVDRTVAQATSAALAKAIRTGSIAKRFVAVTCHHDIVPWLAADWVLDLSAVAHGLTGQLHWRSLRRPRLELELYRCPHSTWQLFKRHHYLSANLNPFAEAYLLTWQQQPVAFGAILNGIGRRNIKRISRLVVLPEYQGLGIGSRLALELAARYHAAGNRVLITASHPAMIASLQRSLHWRITRFDRCGHTRQHGAKESASASWGRAVVRAEYISK